MIFCKTLSSPPRLLCPHRSPPVRCSLRRRQRRSPLPPPPLPHVKRPNSPNRPASPKYVAEFIVNTKYDDIPANVIELGKKTILDGFGLALAGSVSESGPIIRKYIHSLGLAPGKASIIGTPLKVSPRFAALANGIAIHADDYDDTGSALHVNAPVLPAAFAHCEIGRRSGKDFLLGYHVGVEVENKLGDAISQRHNGDGFHTTGTIGSFGSAAACAKLRGLDLSQTARTLGLARIASPAACAIISAP